MTETTTYSVVEHRGKGFSIAKPHGARDTIRFDVINAYGNTVHRGPEYFSDGLTKRQINGMRLAADNIKRRYAYHLAHTGKAWEIEQAEQRGEKVYDKTLQMCIERTERAVAHLAMRCVMGVCSRADVLVAARNESSKVTEKWRREQPKYWGDIDYYCRKLNITFEQRLVDYFTETDNEPR